MDQDLYVGERLLSTLRVVDLKDELMIRGLVKSGTKAELCERLRNAILKEQLAVPAIIPPVFNQQIITTMPDEQIAVVIPSHIPAPSEDQASTTIAATPTVVPSENTEVTPVSFEAESVKLQLTREESRGDCSIKAAVPDITEVPSDVSGTADVTDTVKPNDIKNVESEMLNAPSTKTPLINEESIPVLLDNTEISNRQETNTSRRSRSRSKSHSTNRSRSNSSSSSGESSSESSSDEVDSAAENSQERGRSRSTSSEKSVNDKVEESAVGLSKNDSSQPESCMDVQVTEKAAEGDSVVTDGVSKQDNIQEKEDNVGEIGENEEKDLQSKQFPSPSNKVTENNLQHKSIVSDTHKAEESSNKEVAESNLNIPKQVKMPRRIHLGSKPKNADAVDGSGNRASDTVHRSSWGSRNRATKQTSITISSDVLKDLVPKQTSASETVPEEIIMPTGTGDDVKKDSKSVDTSENMEEQKNVLVNGETEKIIQEHESEKVDSGESRRKIVIVKDDSEENKESKLKGPEKRKATDVNVVPTKRKFIERDIPPDKVAVTRKVPVTVIDEPIRTRSPSPARHSQSNILHVRGLVRPFTINQLKDLLSKKGTLVEEEFWIDAIKSHCIVTYKSVEDAVATRHELHGLRWPSCNIKVLKIDFTTTDEFNRHKGILIPSKSDRKISKAEDRKTSKAEGKEDRKPSKTEGKEDGKPSKTEGKEDRKRRVVATDELEKKSPDKENRISESKRKSRDDHSPKRDRQRKVSPPVREWDRGKIRDVSPLRPRRSPDMREQRRRRSVSPRRPRDRRADDRPRERTPIKRKHEKEETIDKRKEAPAKLLDELFRKTTALPCIYWLPLTEEQSIARRAAIEKQELEGERARAQREAEERLLGRGPGRRRSWSRDRSGGGRFRDRRYRRSRS